MATHTHTTSRRGLLSATPPAVLALSGVAATASACPDADLIALCTACVAQSRAFCAVGQHTWDMAMSNPEWIRCHDFACAMVPGMDSLEDQITDMPARTVAGLLAKAEAARHQLSGDADRDSGPMDNENALAWSLILETMAVLGRAGV